MNKRKLDTEPTPPSIAEADLKKIRDFVECLPSDISVSAVLQRMQETSQPAYRPATKYKDVLEVAKLLNVSFKHNPSHVLRLRDSQLQNTKPLKEHIASTLDELIDSDYFQDRMLEGRTPTILELIFLDRFSKLQDQHASYRLNFLPELSVHTQATSGSGKLVIRGLADWALNYQANNKNPRSESTLIITEAKKVGEGNAGLAQLLIYMVGIHQQRQNQERINRSVFGLLADSINFVFTFLDHDRKFFISRPLNWWDERSRILAYIDAILLDAIESSHTTPTKKGNAVLFNYQQYLGQRWLFGKKAVEEEIVAEEAVEEEIVAEEAVEEEIVAEEAVGEKIVAGEAIGKVVDVDKEGMVVGRERQKKADEEPSSEIAEAE